jgi:hypothetical protein
MSSSIISFVRLLILPRISKAITKVAMSPKVRFSLLSILLLFVEKETYELHKDERPKDIQKQKYLPLWAQNLIDKRVGLALHDFRKIKNAKTIKRIGKANCWNLRRNSFSLMSLS